MKIKLFSNISNCFSVIRGYIILCTFHRVHNNIGQYLKQMDGVFQIYDKLRKKVKIINS